MGPLRGITIVEISGIGPGPFAGMMLADLGATVIRVERPGGGMFNGVPELDILNRGKQCIVVDLKNPAGVDTVLRLLDDADAIFEGFRPGVIEKLGLGPDVCLTRNARLVFGRMTGWGQEGPMAQRAGHDINYIALSGALHPVGLHGQRPTVPLNLVGDFGGGGLMLALGMVCALLEARQSGKGQVVDAAMVDGSSVLMASLFGAVQAGFWREERGSNMVDSGAHFYDTYETRDGEFMAVGAIEPKFYSQLIAGLGLTEHDLPEQMDMEQWPYMKDRFASIFRTKTQSEWSEVFDDTDACVSPVLSMSRVRDHPHNQSRNAYVELDGVYQPNAAPRFSRTSAVVTASTAKLGEHTRTVLGQAGLSDAEINTLIEAGAVAELES
ncbi:MAG: CaiB/BaiF CoA-transferase family protein [Pseudomonadota bacterium]